MSAHVPRTFRSATSVVCNVTSTKITKAESNCSHGAGCQSKHFDERDVAQVGQRLAR